MSGPDRRQFLKQAALASAAAAARSLFPSVTFPGVTFAQERARAPAVAQALTWKKTPCRFCGVGCGLLVGIENGRAVAVRGPSIFSRKISTPLTTPRSFHTMKLHPSCSELP